MDIYTLLVIGHIIGVVLGVGGATFIELNLGHALKDGKVDPIEGGFMKISFTTVRIGLVLSLLTGFGFIIYFVLTNQTARFENPLFWAKMSMVVLVAVNALLLQARRISLYWGSALSFVGWWTALVLSILLGEQYNYSYLSVMAVFMVAVVTGAFVLDFFRTWHQTLSKKKKK